MVLSWLCIAQACGQQRYQSASIRCAAGYRGSFIIVLSKVCRHQCVEQSTATVKGICKQRTPRKDSACMQQRKLAWPTPDLPARLTVHVVCRQQLLENKLGSIGGVFFFTAEDSAEDGGSNGSNGFAAEDAFTTFILTPGEIPCFTDA